MKRLQSALWRLSSSLLIKKAEGATIVEYGLLIGLIACACFVAIQTLGSDLPAFFNFVAGKIASATPS
jgi:Flp pilus assembly pilin Flp